MRRLRVSLLLLAALALPGCLDVEGSARLELDGQGAIRVTARLDIASRDALLQRLAGLYGADPETLSLPFADPWHPRWVRSGVQSVPGLEVGKLERANEEGRRSTIVEATFATLEAAAKGGLFFPAEVRLERLRAPRGKPPSWRLTLTDPWADAAGRADGQIGGRPYAELLDAAEASLATWKEVLVIDLPTPVIQTNGTIEGDGRRVMWRRTRADLRLDSRLVRRVEFQGRDDLDLVSFRHRPDPRDLVDRALEAPPGIAPRDATPEAPKPKEPKPPEPAPSEPAPSEPAEPDAPADD